MKIKDLILQSIPALDQVILFGSYAQGKPTEESDLDYLIITKNKIERKEKLSLMASIRWQSAQAGYKTDFLLKSKNDFIHDAQNPTISKVIAREGRVLWQRS